MGALWSCSSQLPGVSSSSFLLTVWGVALSRLPPYGARYASPTAQAPICCITKYLFSQHPWEAKQHSYAFMALKLQQRKLRRDICKDPYIWRPSALTKQVPFLNRPHNIHSPLSPFTERLLFTWHFWANTLAPGEKGSGFLEEAQLQPGYDSKLINMFQTFHWMQDIHQSTLQQALPHSRTGTHKRKKERKAFFFFFFLYLHPMKSFERFTPW